MDLRIEKARCLRGDISVPGDKSISHRAVMIGALAEGETVVENFLPGEDCLSTIGCFRKLGIEIEGPRGGVVRIAGRGLDGLREPVDILDAGNSGTTMRLSLGILAGQQFFSVITGDDSLRRRPMARVTGPLKKMGASIDGRKGGSCAPLSVRGGCIKAVSHVSPVASAQVKSAMLLAGLFADGQTSVTEPYRSRDHTELMLRYFGAVLGIEDKSVYINGRPRLTGKKLRVPGDISSAAFLLAAAALLPGSDLTVRGLGVNPTRSGIIEVLQMMGADIKIINPREDGGEPVADIRARYAGSLRGISIGGEIIPRLIDEIPVLAVAAAAAEGKTEIRDAAELKVKESDRIAAAARMLSGFGAVVAELDDGLMIRGGRALEGCFCDSQGDHRMAMAAAVAGLIAGGKTVVRGAECIDVSFPGFSELLKSVTVI
ncbi:3-phosphoshikimate 1-carboxyvinyltransferase [Pelotomaculum propionicicum]|uniref:3-phosphoshikimate 1-carboxyvinyltransferase n=1 Tax=Pelotomaculum propionicicum TaxID=258475 RepID=UPI003B7C0D58